MSEVKVEPKVEPTEAITTDIPKNNENGAPKFEADEKETKVDLKTEPDNAAEEGKGPEKQPTGPRTYENGMLKTSASIQYERGGKNSKYDPSVLKTSENPKEIRGQVGSYKIF